MDKESESRPIAAVYSGSSRFHMTVTRLDEAGMLSVIDRLREPVRPGGGLKSSGELSRTEILS
jgi:exopolyphosphatase/guanosine-5'-triphosphate,3'-diphosphate pyrophosphatase